MDTLSPVPGADQGQTRIFPWLALFDKPDPVQEAIREERRDKAIQTMDDNYAATPRFDHKHDEKFKHNITVKVTDAHSRGETYGTEVRTTQRHRLDLLV